MKKSIGIYESSHKYQYRAKNIAASNVIWVPKGLHSFKFSDHVKENENIYH